MVVEYEDAGCRLPLIKSPLVRVSVLRGCFGEKAGEKGRKMAWRVEWLVVRWMRPKRVAEVVMKSKSNCEKAKKAIRNGRTAAETALPTE